MITKRLLNGLEGVAVGILPKGTDLIRVRGNSHYRCMIINDLLPSTVHLVVTDPMGCTDVTKGQTIKRVSKNEQVIPVKDVPLDKEDCFFYPCKGLLVKTGDPNIEITSKAVFGVKPGTSRGVMLYQNEMVAIPDPELCVPIM